MLHFYQTQTEQILHKEQIFKALTFLKQKSPKYYLGLSKKIFSIIILRPPAFCLLLPAYACSLHPAKILMQKEIRSVVCCR